MMTLLVALALHTARAAVPQPGVAAGECFVMAPPTGAETVLGGDECDRRTLPASTFKIPHALVALETGVVTAKTVMKWDGAKKDFPVWERNHSLDSAIKSSVWFFQRAAESIGRQRELQYLRVPVRVAGLSARGHRLMAERRPHDLAARAGGIPPADVLLRSSGRPATHRRRESGDDDARREGVERVGRA